MHALLASIVHIGLFGGSSVATTYLPEETKHHVVLEKELSAAYPGQEIKVSNLADNGEFIARYLLNGKYEIHRADLTGLDVAIIRFGTNDIKRMKRPEYRKQLDKFVALLQEDFPGVQIIMETGMYLDYPKHYSSDRNASLNPVWQASRDLAQEKGFPLVDFYEAAKEETAAGNWDLRVRARAADGPFVLDASRDAGKENNPKWFTDIHPNPEGVRVAVREEVKAIREKFSTALPVGQQARPRDARNQAAYAEYLDFSPDRLTVKPKVAPDQLQDASR